MRMRFGAVCGIALAVPVVPEPTGVIVLATQGLAAAGLKMTARRRRGGAARR